MRKPNLSKKVLLSLGALGAAGAIAGMGTFATFTSTTSASQTVTAGKVEIALGATGTANRLDVAATKVVAGDTIQRAVDLISTSTDPLSTVKLTTTATASSILDTDTSTGLNMYIQNCASAWAEAGTSPAYTYTCAGGATPVLGSLVSPVNVITTTSGGVALANLTATTTGTGTTDHLMITLTLPAGNSLANLATPPSSVIQYSFTGTQRAATSR